PGSLGRGGQSRRDTLAERGPGLGRAVQADVGPVVHRLAEGLPVVLVVGALVLDRRAAAGEGRVDRSGMVLVEARMDRRLDRLAHGREDGARGVALAREGTAEHPRETQAALGEVFAEPARLALAELREAVVVLGTEG